jgi:hypothetical protein
MEYLPDVPLSGTAEIVAWEQGILENIVTDKPVCPGCRQPLEMQLSLGLLPGDKGGWVCVNGKCAEARAIKGQRRVLDLPGNMFRLHGHTFHLQPRPIDDPTDGKTYYCRAERLAVVVSRDATRHGVLLHASMSHPSRMPSWDLMHTLRDVLYPDDVDVMMLLPRREDYVNLHPYCLHLWQAPDAWLIR